MSNKQKVDEFTRQYTSALQDYLVSNSEAGLEKAYEIGRSAMAEGLGVLDVASAYHESFVALLSLLAPEERKRLAASAAMFLAESLSSFEMTHRSFREANASLQKMNEALERRVKERTSELESVNRELNDFAHIVSHDLKAPLSALQSIADLFTDECSDRLDEEGRELLGMLTKCTIRMQKLIDGILQYSKAGRIGEDRIEVDLNRLVKEVLEMLGPPGGIEITIGKLPVILCEKTRIQQVFQNLLSNAVKYQDKPDGKITISSEELGHRWKFTISDNGRGIPAPDLEKIFQLFVALDRPANGTSTGVGLAVVKKIIEMYGGRVHVESQVGVGSAFSFTLPKRPEPEYPAP